MRAQPAPQTGEQEQHLLEVARRAARQESSMLVLALHLSALPPPAPRPHHRRIAGAILEDAARRHGGQMLALGGGDLVLLLPGAGDPGDAAALPELLLRLVGADAPGGERVVSLWRLPAMAGAVLEYATLRALEPEAGSGAAPPGLPAAEQIGAIERLRSMAVADGSEGLLRRQTAILLPPGNKAGRVEPLFSEIAFSIPTLEARAGLHGGSRADPFLFRWLAARLDQGLLEVLGAALGQGGPLDATAQGTPTLHLNLSLQSAALPAFVRFVAQCRDAGRTLGAEIALPEACADPRGYRLLRDRFAASGLSLVLDDVSYLSAGLSELAGLEADLVKLDWAPRMAVPDCPAAAQLSQAVARIGASRIVLHHADSEAALRWGLAHGIRRYQGRHAEAMLAASRMAGCSWSAGCDLRRCLERGIATAPAARRFCRNPDLLDRAAPPAPVQARAA